jgi:preprotein translocase subunit YajC
MSIHIRRSSGLQPLKNVNLPPSALDPNHRQQLQHQQQQRSRRSQASALVWPIMLVACTLVVYFMIYSTLTPEMLMRDKEGEGGGGGRLSTKQVPSASSSSRSKQDKLSSLQKGAASGITATFEQVDADTDIDTDEDTDADIATVDAVTVATHTRAKTEDEPIRIAHVVSMITCHKASRVKGFLDAFVVLRHSVHQNSVHAQPPRSKYSYQMYAIVHQDGGCADYSDLLQRLGYITIIRPTPVDVTQLPDGWYKSHVENENCCGSKEFIKLYAYTLTDHPVVVHWDLDTAVLQPMDDLYDAMIYSADSVEGQAARSRLAVQHKQTIQWPDRIDAFLTRDVTSAQPWEKIQAVQGGFVVARPNPDHLEMYKEFIMKADYQPGRGEGSGWGGLGYGGFQGAMAYQGVLAYFYDVIYPGHHVELDVCRWNQVVADVIWRGPDRIELNGTCRDYPLDGDFTANTPENGRCEDCRILPIEETMTVHYTACKKPWECAIPYPRKPRNKEQEFRLSHLTNITTCGLLFEKYFAYRHDIEGRIAKLIGRPVSNQDGTYFPEYFKGFCNRAGSYNSMEDIPVDLDFKNVYGF